MSLKDLEPEGFNDAMLFYAVSTRPVSLYAR